MTTPGGTSKTSPQNLLEGSDDAFTTGTGSWRPNVNATVALSSDVFRSRPYSLEVKPRTQRVLFGGDVGIRRRRQVPR